jgi:hypothetical protein
MATRAAAASEAHVADAAREALHGGNAVDAVIAGVLAAAAHDASVFLGPLQVLVAGGGAGRIAVDGRNRQPGLDAPRPRGTLEGQAIPPPSRVGVPTLPATVAAVLASFGSVSLRKVGRSAVDAAQRLSAPRAAVIDAFTRRGVPALTDDLVASELLAAAGRAAGGQLSAADLAAFRPPIVRVEERSFEPPGWLRLPWRDAFGGTGDAGPRPRAPGRGASRGGSHRGPCAQGRRGHRRRRRVGGRGHRARRGPAADRRRAAHQRGPGGPSGPPRSAGAHRAIGDRRRVGLIDRNGEPQQRPFAAR